MMLSESFVITTCVALLVGWFIHVLSESVGGEQIFEPVCVCVGVRVKMKVHISDDDAVGMISSHVLNKKFPLPKKKHLF